MYIVYILDEFPSETEYFIFNEIAELAKRGFIVQVLAMRKKKNAKGNGCHPLLPPALYNQGYFSIGIIAAHLYLIHKYGNKYTSVITNTVLRKGDSLITLLKRFKVFLTGGYFLFLLRKARVEHIHAHFCSVPADIAIIMSELSGIGFSCSAHARDIFTGQKEDLRIKIERAKFIITCTNYNKRFLQRLAKENNVNKISHVYHGIDLAGWPEKKTDPGYPNQNKVRLLTVCRLVEKKGIIFLLEAIKLLREQGLRIECSIIGDGPLREQIEDYRDLNSLNTNVHLHGALPQSAIKAFYLSADMFVLPSIVAADGDRDGLPNVLVEALAVGVPVITTSISAIPELVIHELTGIVVPDRSPNSIRDAVLRLLQDKELCKRIARNGRRKVEEEFSISSSTDRLVKLFTSNRQCG